jgi:predicted nucleic acid-binding protein
MTTNLAVDTSSLVALISGQEGRDVELLMQSLPDLRIVLPTVVYVEACSNHKTRARMKALLASITQLEIQEGFWFRASLLRADILAKKLKANLADTLIAQSCIDHGVALITRDTDFRHFAKHGGLKLAVK